MAQQSQTDLLRGGVNQITPPIAMPAGHAIRSLNYEPVLAGYRRMDGYERFDGRVSPSSVTEPAEQEGLRALIQKVPGEGPVRGVHVFEGSVWAMRNKVGGASAAMFKATPSGWVEQTFGTYIYFNTGTAEFIEGQVVTGGTSGAVATIRRVVQQSGAFGTMDATGYLVLDDDRVGDYQDGETLTSAAGSATAVGTQQAIELPAGGRYNFVNHNFYGALFRPRMYFASGAGPAYEWNNTHGALTPIETAVAAGAASDIVAILAQNGDTIIAANGDAVIASAQFNRPTYVSQFQNHLFLGFEVGAVICSGIGEPVDFRAIAGAVEFAFGESMTGMVSQSSSLIMLGYNRISYITGHDASDFSLNPITVEAGALPYTAQVVGSDPIYMDDAGLRRLSTTAAFGDWKLGTISRMMEKYFDLKRKTGVSVAGALPVRDKDQYRIYFDDQTGVIAYVGRREPELMPFQFPSEIFCTGRGQLVDGEGDRYFVGAQDGYVYEIDAGTSFDGAQIQAYVQLAWNSMRSPRQDKVYRRAVFEIDSEDDITIGASFEVDYAIPENVDGDRVNSDVAAGALPSDAVDYDLIDWTTPQQGELDVDLDGIGRNLSITLVSEHTYERPHTLSSMTVNFSPRKMNR